MAEIFKHWPLAATIIWLCLGVWVFVQTKKARRPLPEGVGLSPGRAAFRRFVQSRAALVGSGYFYLMVLLCLLGPWVIEVTTGITYTKANLKMSALPPAWWEWFGSQGVNGKFAPWVHFLGTDALGQDLFVRLLTGGRISIAIGLFTTFVTLGIGIVYGAVAGYIGGLVDQVMMRFIDVLYTLPYITLVIVVMTFFGRNMFVLFLAIAFVGWLTLARITRGEVLSLKHKEFVEAAVATGSRPWSIIRKHLIPNTLGPVIVYATVIVPRVMMEEAFLSYLGFGVQQPLSSWGTLINDGVHAMRYQPWLLIFPVAFFVLTLYALNYVGDGVRDAFDPRTRGFASRRTRTSLFRSLVDGFMSASVADRLFGPVVTIRSDGHGQGQGVLSVRNLTVEFDTDSRPVRAVDHVSFHVNAGETLFIVGESGSGKSVTVKALTDLNPSPPCIVPQGDIYIAGKDLLRCSPRELREVRGNRIAMIFQDPMSCLNPYQTIGVQLLEVLTIHGKGGGKARVLEMLDKVGIPDPSSRFHQHPHQLSGGMRQRVMIAMALLSEPEVLIADEPTTGLDVTIQAQILELLKSLQKELGMAMIFITHDLGVVREIADHVMVMYAGSVVESGPAYKVFANPAHPYTRALLASVPSLEHRGGDIPVIPGEPPDLRALGRGCPFAPRCPLATGLCRDLFPGRRAIVLTWIMNSSDHVVRCHTPQPDDGFVKELEL